MKLLVVLATAAAMGVLVHSIFQIPALAIVAFFLTFISGMKFIR